MSEKKIINVKDAVRKIAEENGVDSEKAIAIAEKCYMDIPSWQPYGGATSFAQIDQQKAVREYSYSVDDQTTALRGIIENITSSDDFDVDTKATAIQAAAAEFKNRVNSLKIPTDVLNQENDKSIIGKLRNMFLKNKSNKARDLPVDRGFKVFEDKEGNLRWLSFSSNAFEDKDKELFTTLALEEAIEHADKTDERGPLLFFHVPSAEIGQCDFQGMAGRFLVESGTFNDTPLGRKAVEYFVNSDEEHQVSIGYYHLKDDDKDGTYDWLRIKERSVCPDGMAANSWTDFRVIGKENMNQVKVNALEKVFGKELTAQVIVNAENATKELEATTRFKSKEPVTLEISGSTYEEFQAAAKEAWEKAKKPAEDIADGGADDSTENPDGSKKKPAAKEASEGLTAEQTVSLATLIVDLTKQVEDLAGIKDIVASLETKVKELSKSDDEKVANIVAPKTTTSQSRPSEDEKNVADLDKIKDIVKDAQEQDENPAMKYLRDLVGPVGSN